VQPEEVKLPNYAGSSNRSNLLVHIGSDRQKINSHFSNG